MAQDKVSVASDCETEKQEAMAFLRERYLYLLSSLCGAGDCEIKMYENTNVKCRIKAFDSNFENIIVEDLQTPMPIPINKAILRTNDLISMKFNCDYTELIK
ncbi:uncharacterized protein LOC123004273 isoform X2 [Tribolium madens]|uniref:uncharacterized protein LOC123004273 isoform X2 n=1 Tax=Tribolium madens TaxID=41895 RepID=UPI001CF7535E|nr:uncharacterized protein LOC123004273 isoform X2 [Tribolium madens]